MRRWLVPLLKISLAVGLLSYLLVSEIRSDENAFRSVGSLAERWEWFLAALAAYGVILLLAAWRWKFLLAAQGLEYSTRQSLNLILIGHFFNQFMLGSTGGDVVKAYYVATDYPGKKAAGILTVFFDRLVGLFVLICIAGVAVTANLDFIADDPWLKSLSTMLWGSIVAALLACYIFYSERVRSNRWLKKLLAILPFQGFLRSITDAVYVYKFHPRRVCWAFAISVGIHVLVVLMNVCVAYALLPAEKIPPLAVFFLLVPLCQMVMGIPVTPSGYGTGESAYKYLFRQAGVSEGFMISLVQRLVYYVWALAGCYLYLRFKRKYLAGRNLEAVEGQDDTQPSQASGSPVGGV